MTINSIAANVSKDVQALRASQDTCKAELEFYKAEIEAYTARVEANMGVSGPSQVSPTPKGSALQTPTYNGARNAREINNFFWKLEAYFGAVDIKDEV